MLHNTLTVAFYTDGKDNYGYDAPGSKLFSNQFTIGTSTDWYGSSGLSWLISSGTYWVSFEVGSSDTYFGAAGNSAINPLSKEAVHFMYPYSAWNGNVGEPLKLGVRIEGNDSPAPVPEPSVMLLMGIGGIGGLVEAARRRKKAC